MVFSINIFIEKPVVTKMLAGLGAGVVLTSPTGDTVQYVLQIMYTDSNNAAEYEALLHGLRMAVSMGIQRLEVHGDQISQYPK